MYFVDKNGNKIKPPSETYKPIIRDSLPHMTSLEAFNGYNLLEKREKTSWLHILLIVLLCILVIGLVVMLMKKK